LDLISAASEADGRTLGEGVREAILKAAHSSSAGVGADHRMTDIAALQLVLDRRSFADRLRRTKER